MTRGRVSGIEAPHGTVLLGVTADTSLGLMQGFPQYLSEQGWSVHVVASPGPRSDQLGRDSRIHVHTIRMKRDPSLISDIRSLIGWLRLVWTVRPDVVAVGTPKAGLLGAVASWALRVPDRVYILRGLRLETTSGVLRSVLSWAEKLTFSLSTRAIAVSPSLRHEAITLGLTGERKISVVGSGSSNGVDLDRFRPRSPDDPEITRLRDSLGLQIDRPTIGFVGRLNADKGLETLSAALRILDARPLNVQLLVVGEQDGSAVVDDLHSGGHVAVLYAGQIVDASIYYSLMDLLCLPTRREGFPNVVLEAAATGVPTVTTNATGAVDAVIESQTGLIVDKRDPVALAGALEKLIIDAEMRVTLGDNARRWVVDHFDQASVWANTNEYLRAGSPTWARGRQPRNTARLRNSV